MMDKSEVFLDLGVTGVMPIAEDRVIEFLEKKMEVAIKREFLKRLPVFHSKPNVFAGGLPGDDFKNGPDIFEMTFFLCLQFLLRLGHPFFIFGRFALSLFYQVNQFI